MLPAKQVVLERLYRTDQLHIKLLMVYRIVYNGESMFSYLKINFYLGLKVRNIACDAKNSVNKGIFHFRSPRIWAHMQVYSYENRSGYVTAFTNISVYLNLQGYIFRFIFRQLRVIFSHKILAAGKIIFLRMHNTILQRGK